MSISPDTFLFSFSFIVFWARNKRSNLKCRAVVYVHTRSVQVEGTQQWGMDGGGALLASHLTTKLFATYRREWKSLSSVVNPLLNLPGANGQI